MNVPDPFAAIAERLLPDARVCEVWHLTGGVSADVHAVSLEGADGRRRTVVVRRHGDADWKARHGQVVVMEHDLLQALYRAGLMVPKPLLVDTTGHLLPGPYLVMDFVDGSTEVPADALDACLDVMAATLVRLHTLSTAALPELPLRTDPLPELFDYLPDLAEWHELREHLHGWQDSRYQGRPALLHGDFWPGNLLWRDGSLVAILDWEDAAFGDPMADVAGCRLELLWKHGPAAVERFTRSYLGHAPLDLRRLALWEVFVGSAAACFMGAWGLAPAREADMRRKAQGFVREAARALLSRPV